MARRKKKGSSPLRDYGLAIVCAILLAFAIRFFFVEAYRMPSRAMFPAVEAGDTLFVSKIAYGLRIPFTKKRLKEGKLPNRADVVVLEFPEEPGREYIKRVVALPGERIGIRSGHLILNGEDRSRENSDDPTKCGSEMASVEKTYSVCWEAPLMDDVQETLLGEDEVFVIGDLRSKGLDTKRLKLHGKVTLKNIRGKATTIWLSVNNPRDQAGGSGWISRIRFDRLFKKIE